MRRQLSFLLLFFILFGCSAESTNQIMEEKNESATVTDENKQPNVEEKQNEEPSKEDNKANSIESEKQSTPKYYITKNWQVKPISNANKNIVLLTIDDAPDKYALEMAKTLKELNVPAIFFVNGHFITTDEKKQILKEIHDMGFMIGNHTFHHKNLNDLTEQEQYNEIVDLNNEIEKIIGERPVFFRAPFGQYTDYSKKIIAEEGMLYMNWSYGYDWEKKYTSKDAIENIMINNPYLADGSILLMHDRDWTNQALRGIVTGLQAKGYEIVDPEFIQLTQE